ncbi:MAG: Serine/threonine protein kinase [Actinomycetia bacterium]|nr:Serine/threonine protein kinase [Actinomycetes bacterium]
MAMTDRSWIVFPDGEEVKSVRPGQRLGIRPMTIDFGPVRARVTLG